MGSRFVLSRRRLLVGSVGAAIAAVAPVTLSSTAARSTDAMRVNTSGARLRSGPGTGYRILASLAAGTIVRSCEPAGAADGYQWTKCMVETTGLWGYIASHLLSPLETPQPAGDVRVKAGPLRVRSSPGLSGSVLGSVATGTWGTTTTEMPRDADGYVWVYVIFTTGLRGWVAANYLAFVS
ncbi:MAG TPA: SH3 domain-containing protein [Thermomicrobiales bacterium]|nr:SH3 domain-containing protein [Thermomicrobiales bacterium]